MTTKQLYDQFLKYFTPEELFSPAAYRKYKHLGDYFFLSRLDKRLIETLLWIREKKGQKMTINNWLWGGHFDERGVRDTSTDMVKARAKKSDSWLSAHVLSMGADYDIEGETAAQHRQWLNSVANELPHPIRLERKFSGKPITWVHLDVCDDPRSPKVYQFDV
ncbi:MAG: hypothetical protein KKC03_06555 [Bacteroidetes bacterium]|nr:hypothetical protein [Bacteroidota bacterium]